MILLSHSLIALSTTKFINNPILLFFTNIILHYIFDAIPHEKELKIIMGFNNNKNKIYLFFLNIFVIILMCFLFYKNYHINMIKIIFAVSGAIMPDLLGGLYRISSIKSLKWASDLNHFAHKIILIKQRSYWFYLFQLIPFVIFILIFYR